MPVWVVFVYKSFMLFRLQNNCSLCLLTLTLQSYQIFSHRCKIVRWAHFYRQSVDRRCSSISLLPITVTGLPFEVIQTAKLLMSLVSSNFLRNRETVGQCIFSLFATAEGPTTLFEKSVRDEYVQYMILSFSLTFSRLSVLNNFI